MYCQGVYYQYRRYNICVFHCDPNNSSLPPKDVHLWCLLLVHRPPVSKSPDAHLSLLKNSATRYVNTMLASLNARKNLKGNNSVVEMTAIGFESEPSRLGSGTLDESHRRFGVNGKASFLRCLPTYEAHLGLHHKSSQSLHVFPSESGIKVPTL